MYPGGFWQGHRGGWDREPRLVDPSVLPLSDVYHHAPSGAMTASYVLRGQWSDRALLEVQDGLAEMVPGRCEMLVLDRGRARVLVHLGITESDLDPSAVRFEYIDDLDATLHGSAWALDRGAAALDRGPAWGIPRPERGLPVADGELRAAFARAEAEFGADAHPPGTIGPPGANPGTVWSALRETSEFDLRENLYRWPISS